MKTRQPMLNHRSAAFAALSLLILLMITDAAIAEKPSAAKAGPGFGVGWSTFLRGGYIYQFKTDMDSGGSFSADRAFFQGGVSYAAAERKSISLALGYGFDDYDFSGHTGLAGLSPWDKIHSYRISAPIRWGFNETWTLFVIPTARVTKESGADTDDALAGGGFAGFSYRVNDRLTIGPGVGVVTQIEDSATVFPVLIIDWKITDTLSLGTGRGLGATLGPGLALNWKPMKKWNFTLGGRYERLRFRLDNEGAAPNGVGEDRSFPLFAGATYIFSRKAQVGLLGGLELGGKLRLEDKYGNEIIEENHDPAGFIGISFNLRF
jgi:hypothetical protein